MVLLACLMVLAGCGEEEADQKTYKVGILQYVDDASLDQICASICEELDEEAEEHGVVFEYEGYLYNGQGDGTLLHQMASQLVDDEVDVIIPIATPAAQIVQTVTEETQTPVVFSAVSDPAGAKLVESMDAPGSHITGTSDALNTGALLDLLFAVDPDADKVGLLYSTSQDSSKKAVEEARKYLEEKGVECVEKTGVDTAGIVDAANALAAEGVDAVFTPTDNTVMTAELSIFEIFAQAGIPHYAGADSFALNGAFVGYGVDYEELGRETADMAVEILLEGKDPSEMAVRTFDDGIALVNTETMEKLGYRLEDVKERISPYCTKVEETTTKKSFE